ncbi:MAG: hypothetical protein K5Q68_01860 [Roseococcus sp.]|nr:hypothetical protein [Roseococcus sp.]
MSLRLLALALCLASGPALAQGGNCVANQLLRVDAAFSRHGAGGTFDYSVQVTNLSPRQVTFRVSFRMTNAQVNPQILGQAFTLPPNGNRIIVLGNGRDQSLSTRIAGGVTLTC